MNLNIIDWFVLLILVASIALSAMKGFVRELLGLASLLAAFLLGAWFYRLASEPFKEVVKTENIALFLGFAIVFFVTLLAGSLVVWIAQKLIKFAKVQWFDRLLGAAFGFVRGWVLGSIVLLALTSFGLQAERGALRDVGAEDVTRRDLRHGEVRGDELGLRALARSRRTHQHQPHHGTS